MGQAIDELWPALVDFSQMAEVGEDEVLLRANVRSSDSLASLSAYDAQCEALGLSAAALARRSHVVSFGCASRRRLSAWPARCLAFYRSGEQPAHTGNRRRRPAGAQGAA